MRPMPELRVEEMPVDSLVPYARNAKVHTEVQVDQIVASIEEFGFNDPVAVWHNDKGEPEVVEGHGRILAAKKLGLQTVPVITLDALTDEQRRAYALVHNKLTMNTGFDFELLDAELQALEFDWGDFGFDTGLPEQRDDDVYTKKTPIPQYDVLGVEYAVSELMDARKADKLISEIDRSSVTDEEKIFLKHAAMRHVVFNYACIAEYYAQATPEFQRLAEESALVIIDVDDAIALGYAKLSDEIERMRDA